MRKLEKYLLKKCDIYQESNSTNSKYFQLENCKIRLSDHFSHDSDSCDLSIVIPLNKSTKYIVSGSDSSSTYLWNTNEITEFIPHLIKFCNLKHRQVKSEVPEIKIVKILSKFIGKKGLSSKINSIVGHPKNDFWSENEIPDLISVINSDLNCNITSFPKEFEEFLLTHCSSYNKLLNIYKAAYIDNKLDNINNEILIRILNSI